MQSPKGWPTCFRTSPDLFGQWKKRVIKAAKTVITKLALRLGSRVNCLLDVRFKAVVGLVRDAGTMVALPNTPR
jgi:hypothetical protein